MTKDDAKMTNMAEKMQNNYFQDSSLLLTKFFLRVPVVVQKQQNMGINEHGGSNLSYKLIFLPT